MGSTSELIILTAIVLAGAAVAWACWRGRKAMTTRSGSRTIAFSRAANGHKEDPMMRNRRDWTLVAIAAAPDHCLTPVQLQKSLFIFGDRLPQLVGEKYYRFRPYNYGPFSAEVYHDAEELAADGLLSIESVPGQRWPQYCATAAGIECARIASAAMPAEVHQYLKELVGWAKSLRFRDLLEAVYSTYPEYAVNSVFRG
ncbi:hypothetical protein [Fontivita pretiosa]|uniref:hypothetical protein n=1 Tax=Fontivita pretiosa TaxID=2989684 RepID=UPI003D17BB19